MCTYKNIHKYVHAYVINVYIRMVKLISIHVDTAEIRGNAQTDRQMDKQTAF